MRTLSPNTRTQLIKVNGKKVRKSRWLMEQHLGRSLLPTEHVHHINGNPLDNRLENLEVMTQNAHLRMHKQIYPDEKVCELCGQTYICNPRKRKRQKTCSYECGRELGRLRMTLTKRRASQAASLGGG